MIALLYALNILAGLFLVGVVLLQSGKGADMGAAFGGANSAVFGPSGPGNALTKITAATAALFMVTALSLSVISSRENSVFDGMAEPTPIGGTPSPVATPTPAAPTDGAEEPAASTPPSFEDQVKKAQQKAVEDASGAGGAAADDAVDTAGQAAGLDSAAQAPAADTDAAKKAATGAVDGVTE